MFKLVLIILALALIGLVGTTTHYAFANNMGPAMGPADSGGGGGGGGSVDSSGPTTTTTSPGVDEGWQQHTWNNPSHEHLFSNDEGYHWWNHFSEKPHWFWNLPGHHWWNGMFRHKGWNH